MVMPLISAGIFAGGLEPARAAAVPRVIGRALRRASVETHVVCVDERAAALVREGLASSCGCKLA